MLELIILYSKSQIQPSSGTSTTINTHSISANIIFVGIAYTDSIITTLTG